ncbi:ABC-F family ATP-binding cassette domain-containing protein [Armatimonas rosea]|uniref:ATP-binding cassette subfamily F protein 3 n=1 Tax=Armatimonas rosea TaxID=685828 RepID=A0A7W9SVS3_ARMRO|nr:ABC-F family ATP-binding cassette domain-containing protein [Armatimonas rosea]MBB6053772.1 ATP-binding cassette subfamily F protein 3 [Armatimonas rosea]
MLTAEKIYKSFGPQDVLKDITLQLGDRDRIGVVGLNGQGKSTLIKILAGLEEPDKGVVHRHGSTVGYLNQESQCRLGVTVGEEMRSAFPDMADVEARLIAASQAMAGDASKSDVAALNKATDDLTKLEAHTMDARIGRVLSGLRFELDAVDRLTDTYSGGWQMRIAMAKLLLQEPDYLFLDEPTNHLDTEAKFWLMYDYIPSYPGTVICISHDVEFLNLTSEEIWEVKDMEVNKFKGNYDDYVRLDDERYQRELKAYDAQQREIADWKEFVQRWRGNKSKAGMVESRVKQLEKIDILPKPKERPKTIYLQFPEPPREAPEPISIEDVYKSYGEKNVLNGITLPMVRQDKIALTGPNGAGKSTLLKLVAGVEQPTKGRIIVNPKTEIGYFAQHQAEALLPQRTVYEETLAGIDPKMEELARGLLARLQFRGDDAPFKKIGVLSGGERARVALAKFLLRPANFYLLDEPTNHLDPLAREVLIEALKKFEGTILMSTHDQLLIDTVATGIFDMSDGQFTMVLDPATERIKRVNV